MNSQINIQVIWDTVKLTGDLLQKEWQWGDDSLVICAPLIAGKFKKQ